VSRFRLLRVVAAIFIVCLTAPTWAFEDHSPKLDEELSKLLHDAGFTGNIQRSLESRLGRKIEP